MSNNYVDLDQMQSAYKAAVDDWIGTIKKEAKLATAIHTVGEVDKWENAYFKEEESRMRVEAAKRQYENALRQKFFDL